MIYMLSYQASKERAKKFRREGYSYALISNKLGFVISKNTISDWVKDISYQPNQEVLERVNSALLKSVLYRHTQKLESIHRNTERAQAELGEISKRDLFMLGVGLYLGEGAKSYETIRMINADPDIIRLSILWFKEICGLSDENITITIHLYPDNDEHVYQKHWEKVTGLSAHQFHKFQVDRRENKSLKKRRKLPYGTAHLTIVSNGDSQKGVELHRRIMGWLKAAMNQTQFAGIV